MDAMDQRDFARFELTILFRNDFLYYFGHQIASGTISAYWIYQQPSDPGYTQIARSMVPTWGHLGPVGPRCVHVGPINLVIRVGIYTNHRSKVYMNERKAYIAKFKKSTRIISH